ncbi:MAG: hybrid sensor histidine kinase/response regulator, partial [Candidatus Omnitrophica bacterium]|nr:hybrid sensor histidine kinase/response regulator [Candidatus Omnitrophota bacterium]
KAKSYGLVVAELSNDQRQRAEAILKQLYVAEALERLAGYIKAKGIEIHTILRSTPAELKALFEEFDKIISERELTHADLDELAKRVVISAYEDEKMKNMLDVVLAAIFSRREEPVVELSTDVGYFLRAIMLNVMDGVLVERLRGDIERLFKIIDDLTTGEALKETRLEAIKVECEKLQDNLLRGVLLWKRGLLYLQSTRANGTRTSIVQHEISISFMELFGVIFEGFREGIWGNGDKLPSYVSENKDRLAIYKHRLLVWFDPRIYRFDADTVDFFGGDIDAQTLFNALVDLYSPECKAKGLDFKSTIDIPDGICLTGYTFWLAKALGELLSNAIKFTKEGCVTFSATYEEESQEIRFTITDTGLGVPEETIAMLKKGGASLKRVRGENVQDIPGSGEGFLTAKMLIENQMGRVDIRNAEGEAKGTVVTVTLPAKTASKAPAPALLVMPPATALLAIIEEVNKARQGKDRAKLEEKLNELVRIALLDRSKVKVIVEGLEDRFIKDDFIHLLVEKDQSRPRLNLNISAESLFPIEIITGALGAEGKMDKFNARIQEREDGSINISLVFEDKILATARFFIRNNILIKAQQPSLGDYFESILQNENSGYFDYPIGIEGTARRYYCLNWWADILFFELTSELQGKDIGRIWYEEYIEPYLRRCGVNIIGVHGDCLTNTRVHEFWMNRGFSEGFLATEAAVDSETVQPRIVFKVLPAAPLVMPPAPPSPVAASSAGRPSEDAIMQFVRETEERFLKTMEEVYGWEEIDCNIGVQIFALLLQEKFREFGYDIPISSEEISSIRIQFINIIKSVYEPPWPQYILIVYWDDKPWLYIDPTFSVFFLLGQEHKYKILCEPVQNIEKSTIQRILDEQGVDVEVFNVNSGDKWHRPEFNSEAVLKAVLTDLKMFTVFSRLAPKGTVVGSAGPVIMIVGDKPDDRFMMTKLILENGFRIVWAGNGKEALDILDTLKASKAPVELVVSDLAMPEMNGYELAKQIAGKMPTLIVSDTLPQDSNGDRAQLEATSIAGILSKSALTRNPQMLITLLRQNLPAEGLPPVQQIPAPPQIAPNVPQEQIQDIINGLRRDIQAGTRVIEDVFYSMYLSKRKGFLSRSDIEVIDEETNRVLIEGLPKVGIIVRKAIEDLNETDRGALLE